MASKPASDIERSDFLNQLDMAPFEVSDWEADFIERNIRERNFTPKQRNVIDEMMEKYEGRLKP